MIHIQRGAEPAELAAERARELPRVRTIAAARRPTKEDIGDRYKVAHDALWRAQHFKCCYCESREQSKRNDVEHFRPKARADRKPGAREDHGYWWMAWTWANLLFACRNCNQPPAKSDQFPLQPGIDLYGFHVDKNLLPIVEDVREALRYGSSDMRRQWTRALQRLLNPAQIYIGLSHDALDQYFPATLRRKHQLELRLP
jgi:uncharacterized protein (TIGR02646 family)